MYAMGIYTLVMSLCWIFLIEIVFVSDFLAFTGQSYARAQTGTTEMSAQDWEVFWEWFKQNPPSTIRITKRWASVLEEKLEKWKTEHW